MAVIKVKVEGEGFAETHQFTTTDVVAHHWPAGEKAWGDLSGDERTSIAEDYALWNFYRRYGNEDELRVDVVELPAIGG